MNPSEARDHIDDHFLLDVREHDEWQAGHVAEAVHIPMGQLNTRIAEIPRDQPIIAICRSGNRSGAVTDALNRAGYTAHNLDGGMFAWAAEGLPVVTDEGEPGWVA